MIRAFAYAFAQLPDPALRSVLGRGVAGAAGIFTLIGGAVWLVLGQAQLTGIAWLDSAVDTLGIFAAVIVAFLLFPAAVSALVGLFLDEVASAVERKHYPQLPAPRAQGLAEQVAAGLRFAAVAVVLNLLALPLYLVLFLVPPLNIFVFYGVNGYLIGREYAELVGLRRLEPGELRGLRRANRWPIFAAGVATAFLLTVPLLNLVAPIVGTAAMVHMMEGLRRRRVAAATA